MHMTNTEQQTDNMAEQRKQSKDKEKDKLNQMEMKQNERKRCELAQLTIELCSRQQATES